MELKDRLSTLPQDQRLRVMERVFQKLLLAFGNQMQAKWQGIDMEDIYADWADALCGCSLGAIDHAIYLSKQEEHPPSQGAFLAFCKDYKPPIDESKLLPDYDRGDRPFVSREDGLKMLKEMSEKLAGKMKVELQ